VPLLLVSVAGWSLLLAGPSHSMVLPAFCGAPSSRAWATVWPGAGSVLLLNPPTQSVLAWLLMLAAMMPPLLARPVEHLWYGGVAKRRARAVGLFIVAYVAVWTLAGVVLMASAAAIEVLGSAAGIPALAATGFVAFIWQTTPLKQASLNFCHRPPRISPSGVAADRDSLMYGVSIALACVGACWALMLIPLVVHSLECLTMAIIAAILLLERQTEDRPAVALSVG
jgi:predicted metal-binding membrane protein